MPTRRASITDTPPAEQPLKEGLLIAIDYVVAIGLSHSPTHYVIVSQAHCRIVEKAQGLAGAAGN